MPIGNYYYDNLSFTGASNVWDNPELTGTTPDGWYSEAGIYREKNGGILGPSQACPSCALLCNTAVSSSTSKGKYLFSYDVGNSSGAVIVKFNVPKAPSKLTWTFDGVTASEYTNAANGYLQGLIGRESSATFSTCPSSIGTPFGITIANGSGGGTFSGTTYTWNPALSTFTNTGIASTLGAYGNNASNEITLIAGSVNQAYMVIPKPNASPSVVSIEVESPCDDSVWSCIVYCPNRLQSWDVGVAGGSCGVGGEKMFSASPFVSDGSTGITSIQVNDWVFEDFNGEIPKPAGNYPVSWGGSQYCVAVDSNGIVTAVIACSGSCL